MVAVEGLGTVITLEIAQLNMERDEKGEFTNSEGSDEDYLTEITILTSPGGKAKLLRLDIPKDLP